MTLRERVAAILCINAEDHGGRPCEAAAACVCWRQADAAIALVREEAARVAGEHHVDHPRTDEWGQGYMTGRQHAAAAIRALEPQP